MPTNRNKELLFVAEAITHFGTFEYNTQGKQLFCSEGVKLIFGWPSTETLPSFESIKTQFEKEDLTMLKNAVDELLKSGKEIQVECRIYDCASSLRYINCYLSLKQINQSDHPVILGVIQEITQSKLKEIEITQTKNKLNKILESSLDIICSVNEAGIYESVSAACYQTLGYKPEEMIGKHYSEFAVLLSK